MKQIIPFKKELLFKTKVSEITSISLEHTLTLKKDDLISGEFYINGDYKMTEGSINREKFQFRLPFDIALDSRYDMATIMIDIDNFYYEIINNESLQVNIDVYVEGEKIIEEIPKTEEKKSVLEEYVQEDKTIEALSSNELENNKSEDLSAGPKSEEVGFSNYNFGSKTNSEERKAPPVIPMPELEIATEEEFEHAVEKSVPPKAILESRPSSHIDEFNLFDNLDNSDTYVTYYVYVVKEEDTLEKVLTKYEVTKEELALYNNIETVTPGTKLIIPSHSNE